MIPPNLLPEPYQSQAFIAGGYAACPALASDMDVWVCAPSPHVSEPEVNDLRVLVHLHHVRDEILKHLHVSEKVHENQFGTRSVSQTGRYFHGTHMVVKVAVVRSHRPQIQILVTDAPDAHIVLSGFDISTHQVAITDRGIIRGRDWTPITIPPLVIYSHEGTPARMKKITERYRYVS